MNRLGRRNLHLSSDELKRLQIVRRRLDSTRHNPTFSKYIQSGWLKLLFYACTLLLAKLSTLLLYSHIHAHDFRRNQLWIQSCDRRDNLYPSQIHMGSDHQWKMRGNFSMVCCYDYAYNHRLHDSTTAISGSHQASSPFTAEAGLHDPICLRVRVSQCNLSSSTLFMMNGILVVYVLTAFTVFA